MKLGLILGLLVGALGVAACGGSGGVVVDRCNPDDPDCPSGSSSGGVSVSGGGSQSDAGSTSADGGGATGSGSGGSTSSSGSGGSGSSGSNSGSTGSCVPGNACGGIYECTDNCYTEQCCVLDCSCSDSTGRSGTLECAMSCQ